MPLTPLQRKFLVNHQLFRDQPPTVWRQWALASRSHAILFIIFSLGSIFLYLEVAPSAGYFYAGIGIGAVLRDIGRFRAVARIWPALSQVLNWQLIDDLLAGREDLESLESDEIGG